MTYNFQLSCKRMRLSCKSVCNKEHKGIICNMTSLSNSTQSTRPIGRVIWEELLILSRFHWLLRRDEWNFCPLTAHFELFYMSAYATARPIVFRLASPQSILVFSGRHHFISNASIVSVSRYVLIMKKKKILCSHNTLCLKSTLCTIITQLQ